MNFENIYLGKNVNVDTSSNINNCSIEDNVKIAKRCSIYGSSLNQLKIGKNSYIGPNTILNGFSAQLTIGHNVSIAQNVNIMTDSGPNASEMMQSVFPLKRGPVFIGNHTWIGASVIIMPNVKIGNFCVVGAGSFVNCSFENDYLVIGGTPAKVIRQLTEQERKFLYDKIS